MALNIKKATTQKSKVNLIINGTFDTPDLQGKYGIYKNILGWEATNGIEIGAGDVYSDAWEDGQVVELDTNQNSAIKQSVKLDHPSTCTFKFKYASRTKNVSSGFKAYFNGNELVNFAAQNKSVREFSFFVLAHECENTVRFEATGTSDGFGATIDDVELYCDKVDSIDKEVDESNNLIKNGNFESPDLKGKWSIFNEIPNWKGTKSIEVGNGGIYNTAWGSTQVTELDANENTVLSQVITLSGGLKCKLHFKYASRTANKSSAFKVRFNGNDVYYGSPLDKSIYYGAISVFTKNGDNLLEFSGEGDSDSLGMTLDDVVLYCQKEDAINYERNLIINGDFEYTDLSGGWKLLASIPGWVSKDGPIEVGRGTIYSPSWGSGQICELDTSKNVDITQKILLYKKTKCDLKFQYVSRTSNESSNFAVKWNDKVIFQDAPTDNKLYSKTITITGKDGYNDLVFSAQGTSDGLGMTIDNVELYCQPGLGINYQKNYVVNGNFESPEVAHGYALNAQISGWTAEPSTEVGWGPLYVAEWGQNNHINELDSTANANVHQTVIFDKPTLCEFSYLYAGRTANESSRAKVYFNNELLADHNPVDAGIRSNVVKVNAVAGDNTIRFQGEGPSDAVGMTIDDVKLFCVDA